MKSYAEVMVEFFNKKFGKLSSEILIKVFMRRMKINSLHKLSLDQQIQFSNFFISRVLKEHMSPQRVEFVKKQLMIKFCIDNATEAISKQRHQKLKLEFETIQTLSLRLGLAGMTNKDLMAEIVFATEEPHHVYLFFDQLMGSELITFLGSIHKDQFDETYYEPLKAFLQLFADRFCFNFAALNEMQIKATVQAYRPIDVQLGEISAAYKEDHLYHTSAVLSLNNIDYPLRVIYLAS